MSLLVAFSRTGLFPGVLKYSDISEICQGVGVANNPVLGIGTLSKDEYFILYIDAFVM